jgi:hypothetical protein
MKATILGNTNLNYSWFVLTYKQGLELLGYEVDCIDYKSNTLANIKNRLISTKPDYCFTHLTFHGHINPIDLVLQMYADVNKKVGTKFIHTLNDARHKDRYMNDISHAFHTAFVGNNACLDPCRKAWKIPVYLAPYSSLVYKNMAKPVPELSFNEPVFTGTPGAHGPGSGYKDDRGKFIQMLQDRMPLKIFKTQSGQDLRHKTPELSVSAKCILGLCTGYDVDGYIDVRPFQYLGTGACMIMRKFKNMNKMIPDDLYYPFNDYKPQDADYVKETFDRIKTEDTTPMRKRAFDYIQQNHNCKIRIGEVLKRINEV